MGLSGGRLGLGGRRFGIPLSLRVGPRVEGLGVNGFGLRVLGVRDWGLGF